MRIVCSGTSEKSGFSTPARSVNKFLKPLLQGWTGCPIVMASENTSTLG